MNTITADPSRSALREPSDTVVFRREERRAGTRPFLHGFPRRQWERREEIERGRHSAVAEHQDGGANYAMADGSARFHQYRGALYPLNLGR